jgi:ribonucleoside-diphosphate reductase alpha chain
MACVIANSVIVGGVRRSAMISLSDLHDVEMANAKSGNWWEAHPYRALANNSAVYEEKPQMDEFMDEWTRIYRSYSGERGVFNRQAAQLCSHEIGRDDNHYFGTNPCGEITLRPMQFCNLTEVVLRKDDTTEEVLDKIEAATIIGCIQAACTHFPYLRPQWRLNTEEEALLGVSLTGIADFNPSDHEYKMFRQMANDVAEEYSEIIGIAVEPVLHPTRTHGPEGSHVQADDGRRRARRTLCQQPG